MADTTKNEGQPNNETAHTTTGNIAADRVAIACPQSSPHTFKFKLAEVTVEKLRVAFNIQSVQFFLVDEANNIEFANDAQSFEVHADRVYKVLLSDTTAVVVNEEQKNDDVNSNADIFFGQDQKVKISVLGNEDGRKTARGWYLTAHGTMERDKRDSASFYVIGHRDANKVGVWKLHPHMHGQKQRNLFKIQLLKVSDGRKQGRNRWLAVHGSMAKDKRNCSMYAMITDEAHKASIWELVQCLHGQTKTNGFIIRYIRLHGNVDGRSVGVGAKLAIHDSNKLDRRDAASLMVHARSGDHKGTLWKIEKY